MPNTMPAFYKDFLAHIERKIERLSEQQDEATHARAYQDRLEMLERDRIRLSSLIERLPDRDRRAIMFVLAEESDIFMFQFILACAHLLNETAWNVAIQSRGAGTIDAALKSFQDLVHA